MYDLIIASLYHFQGIKIFALICVFEVPSKHSLCDT